MISVLGAAYASVLARIRRGSQISRGSAFIAGLSISGSAPSLARLRLWGGPVQAHVPVGDACVEILLGADAEAEPLIERSEEHTSELQSRPQLVCCLLRAQQD